MRPIDADKLVEELLREREKETIRRGEARRHKHYVEESIYNHGVQILNKAIAIAKGLAGQEQHHEQ